MLLVVDFSDLDMGYDRTDVRININKELTVGKLLKKLFEGIEEISGENIQEKHMLRLLSPKRQWLDATLKMKDVPLNDWDMIYIVRGN